MYNSDTLVDGVQNENSSTKNAYIPNTMLYGRVRGQTSGQTKEALAR